MSSGDCGLMENKLGNSLNQPRTVEQTVIENQQDIDSAK